MRSRDDDSRARSLDLLRDGSRAARRAAEDAKLEELRERRADRNHPRGHVRSCTAAVRYLLTDCPWVSRTRHELATALGCSVRSVDYAHRALRGDGDYAEREHALASDPDLRGQLPLERAIVRIEPRESQEIHPGVQALSDLGSRLDDVEFTPSDRTTDLRAIEEPPPDPGDLSAREFARAIVAHARTFDSRSRVPQKLERVADVPPVPVAMSAPRVATRAKLARDPVELPMSTIDALASNVDPIVFGLVCNSLRHPSCFVDPEVTNQAVHAFISLDDAERADIARPGGWIVRVVERGLRGEDLVDRRVSRAELEAIQRNPDLSEDWSQYAAMVGLDYRVVQPTPAPRTRDEWLAEQQRTAAEAAAERAEDAARKRFDAQIEARADALDRDEWPGAPIHDR